MHLGEAHWLSLLIGEQKVNSKQKKILVHPLSDTMAHQSNTKFRI